MSALAECPKRDKTWSWDKEWLKLGLGNALWHGVFFFRWNWEVLKEPAREKLREYGRDRAGYVIHRAQCTATMPASGWVGSQSPFPVALLPQPTVDGKLPRAHSLCAGRCSGRGRGMSEKFLLSHLLSLSWWCWSRMWRDTAWQMYDLDPSFKKILICVSFYTSFKAWFFP